jgi:osmotically-inducible protein OsmY
MKKTIGIFSFLLIFSGVLAQNASVTLSGLVRDSKAKTALSFVNIMLKTAKDSAFVSGTVSNEEGRFAKCQKWELYFGSDLRWFCG